MFTKQQTDKIGNMLVYLSSKIENCSILKAIKLLYIIDESAIKEIGVPVSWLEYKVWKRGPVPPYVYDELRYNRHSATCCDSLLSYVKTEKDKDLSVEYESFTIKPLKKFDDSEFSDYEIELMKRVVKKYGQHDTNKLIKLLHKEGSLWDTVKNSTENIESLFEIQGNRSDITLQFIDLIIDDEYKKEMYKSSYESRMFQQSLSCE